MSHICPPVTFFDVEANYMSWIFLFSFIVIYGISRSFIAFRQLREITEDISERIEDEARPTPFIAMVDIQEAEVVNLRENDAMRVVSLIAMVDDTRRAAISNL